MCRAAAVTLRDTVCRNALVPQASHARTRCWRGGMRHRRARGAAAITLPPAPLAPPSSAAVVCTCTHQSHHLPCSRCLAAAGSGLPSHRRGAEHWPGGHQGRLLRCRLIRPTAVWRPRYGTTACRVGCLRWVACAFPAEAALPQNCAQCPVYPPLLHSAFNAAQLCGRRGGSSPPPSLSRRCCTTA